MASKQHQALASARADLSDIELRIRALNRTGKVPASVHKQRYEVYAAVQLAEQAVADLLTRQARRRATEKAPLSPWRPVRKDSLPPGRGGGQHAYSDCVWLALKDGRVLMGSCLHRPEGATYSTKHLVHCWFINTPEHPQGEQYLGAPLAWAPIPAPPHPLAHHGP